VPPTQLVAALEGVAARLGIPIRYEAMERTHPRRPAGGLCLLRGRPLILVDGNLGPQDKVAILAKALAQFDLDAIYLPRAVRAAIRAQGRQHVLEPRPLARVKPTSR
jgi:hypothetical protein